MHRRISIEELVALSLFVFVNKLETVIKGIHVFTTDTGTLIIVEVIAVIIVHT